MRQTPQEIKIQSKMQPGVLSLDGFLGNDTRHYHAIVEEDQETLVELGYTQQDIAEKMEYFTNLVNETPDGFINIDDKYEIEYEIVRGKLQCPFSHPGAFQKGFLRFKNLDNGLEVVWSQLAIHMIREHCFFQGMGATHRLDPELLVKALF